MAPPTALPEIFARAVAGLRVPSPRAGDRPGGGRRAPQRLAPYAFALSATVHRDADEVATGRLILLHDPAGHEAWQGTLRLVTYVTAELEPELAADPLLPAVGWTWLTDALDAHEASYRALGGTVTQTLVHPLRRAGRPAARRRHRDPGLVDAGDDDLTPHLSAGARCSPPRAGLPPPGVSTLADRRRTG